MRPSRGAMPMQRRDDITPSRTALRDFNPAYAGSGSFLINSPGLVCRLMSAWPQKARPWPGGRQVESALRLARGRATACGFPKPSGRKPRTTQRVPRRCDDLPGPRRGTPALSAGSARCDQGALADRVGAGQRLPRPGHHPPRVLLQPSPRWHPAVRLEKRQRKPWRTYGLAWRYPVARAGC
jgi:hypothetical protein